MFVLIPGYENHSVNEHGVVLNTKQFGCKESMLRKHMKHKNVVLVKCND